MYDFVEANPAEVAPHQKRAH